MHAANSVDLTRDCEAVQVPSGTSATIPAGTPVHITQTLGGTYTVQAAGGLFRIAAKDADALGLTPADSPSPPSLASTGGAVDEKQIWETLRTCYDPEIPVNIVDLGLVYDLFTEALPGGERKVCVKMTLTAPGCGMGAAIAGDAQQKLLALPGVEEAEVELVWEPPWHPSMISADGRARLGLD